MIEGTGREKVSDSVWSREPLAAYQSSVGGGGDGGWLGRVYWDVPWVVRPETKPRHGSRFKVQCPMFKPDT